MIVDHTIFSCWKIQYCPRSSSVLLCQTVTWWSFQDLEAMLQLFLHCEALIAFLKIKSSAISFKVGMTRVYNQHGENTVLKNQSCPKWTLVFIPSITISGKYMPKLQKTQREEGLQLKNCCWKHKKPEWNSVGHDLGFWKSSFLNTY